MRTWSAVAQGIVIVLAYGSLLRWSGRDAAAGLTHGLIVYLWMDRVERSVRRHGLED